MTDSDDTPRPPRDAKTRVFIGASSEVVSIAEAFQLLLEQSSAIECHLWTHEIEVGRSVLDSLVEKPDRFDFGLFVFAPDDEIESRGERKKATRDNVVFEAGLFTGAIGKERTFYVLPEGDVDFHLPTDLVGQVQPTYDYQRFRSEGRSAIGSASGMIRSHIERLGPRTPRLFQVLGIDPSRMEAFYRRTGLTYAFRKRQEAKQQMLEDVGRAQRSVEMYARVYINELITETEDFGAALARAAAGCAENLTVAHVSTCPSEDSIAAEAWHLEDPERQQWPELENYKSHLRRSDVFFDQLAQQLESSARPEARIDLRRGHLKTLVLPYSLVIIDDQIVYVSFYGLARNPFGKHAPTMRLVKDPEDERSWASYFLKERQVIAASVTWV